ncbi:TPA: LPXTG cell wall anchor domain-containing protein [Bacillus cereus]
MLKKCMFLLLLVPMFLLHDTVLASSMNSKAGITFSNSYTPVTVTDSIIPDGTTSIVSTPDDQIKKKELPQTGGHSSNLFQHLGVMCMAAAFLLLFILLRSETSKNRNKNFCLLK